MAGYTNVVEELDLISQVIVIGEQGPSGPAGPAGPVGQSSTGVIIDNDLLSPFPFQTLQIQTDLGITENDFTFWFDDENLSGTPGFIDLGYLHNQTITSNLWTISHNMGFKPVVSIYTVGGLEIEGLVQHLSNNTLTISFSVSIAGFARLI